MDHAIDVEPERAVPTAIMDVSMLLEREGGPYFFSGVGMEEIHIKKSAKRHYS